jgi:hypothetical protein
MELYSDHPLIAKPDDYEARLAPRNKQELRKVLARRADAKQRQEQAKEQSEDRLYGPQRELTRLRELKTPNENRLYGFSQVA